ncbi:MAG: hypothetical protein U0271_17505 [Polyangiaceae bacterium]
MVSGVLVTHFVAKEKLDAAVAACAPAAARSSSLWARALYYAPASAAIAMARAYLFDQTACSCAAYLSATARSYVGVLVVLGGKGVEKIVELELFRRREGHAREERRQRSGSSTS